MNAKLNALTSKLKAVPPQKLLRWGVIPVALGALVWASLSRGLFDGITLAIAITALALGLMQRLPARPKLILGPRSGTVLIVRHDQAVRPLDEDAIAKSEVEKCDEEMPRRPKPKYPKGSPLDAFIVGADAAERLAEMTSGISDEQLRKYMRKAHDYSIELRKWLQEVEIARADRVRVFEAGLRIHETGQAAADHVRLRMRFPEGFAIDDELPRVTRPPDRPRFQGGLFGSLGRLGEVFLEPNARIRLPGSDRPDYSTEGERVIVDWDLGRINQSEQRDVPEFSLKGADPGSYEIAWEITAEGLAKPTAGTLTIKIEEPLSGEPITDLDEVEDERKSRQVAFSDLD